MSSSPSPAQTAGPARITPDPCDDPRNLKPVLERAAKVEDPRKLLPVVADLRCLLERHFSSEEGRDGLSRTLGASSYLLESLQRSLDEHPQFLAELDRLTVELEGCVRRADQLHRELVDLVGKLRVHEARETELVSEAVYTDIGAAG